MSNYALLILIAVILTGLSAVSFSYLASIRPPQYQRPLPIGLALLSGGLFFWVLSAFLHVQGAV